MLIEGHYDRQADVVWLGREGYDPSTVVGEETEVGLRELDSVTGAVMGLEVWQASRALDIGFDDVTRDQLRWECFGDARPEHPMDGVLVVDPSLADAPFEPMDGHIWLMEASWGSRAPIEGMIVAVGVWEGSEWRADEYE